MVKLHRILEVLRLRDTRSNEKAQWQSAEYKGVINMENGLTEMAPETTAVNTQQSIRQALWNTENISNVLLGTSSVASFCPEALL